MSGLRRLVEGPIRRNVDRLSDTERRIVDLELRSMKKLKVGSRSLLEQARLVSGEVTERAYSSRAVALLRMHEVAGTGNYQSCLSSLPMVEACCRLGLDDPETQQSPAELYVGRGHIAPSFYADRYLRGEMPLSLLLSMHRGGLSGVVHKDWGFRHTMRYSLGVGIIQAVSRAYELATQGQRRKVVCLAGDSELLEGLAYEGLRFASELDPKNLVLMVDANGKGIEELAEPLNSPFLEAFFQRVIEVDGRQAEVVTQALEQALESSESVAIICRTVKGAHSFRPAGIPAGPVPFSKTVGATLGRFTRRRALNAEVFTADMAGRFGLAGHLPYLNVGLSETLSVGLGASLPDETLKVVATDGKYFMDSLNMVTEMTTGVERLLLLAGRSWGVWGGATNANNLLSLILKTRVYEPICEEELEAVFDSLLLNPRTTHVVSCIDGHCPPLALGTPPCIDDGVWVTPLDGRDSSLVLVSYGYATVQVARANEDLRFPHLHCAALRPRLSESVLKALRSAERILSFEYNGVEGGFGEFLRARHLLDCEVHGVTRDIEPNRGHGLQLESHGFDVESLRRTLLHGRKLELVAG